MPHTKMAYVLLSMVALSAFLMLYFFLYPLTAPVYFSTGRLEAAIAILIYAGCFYGARTKKGIWSRSAGCSRR